MSGALRGRAAVMAASSCRGRHFQGEGGRWEVSASSWGWWRVTWREDRSRGVLSRRGQRGELADARHVLAGGGHGLYCPVQRVSRVVAVSGGSSEVPGVIVTRFRGQGQLTSCCGTWWPLKVLGHVFKAVARAGPCSTRPGLLQIKSLVPGEAIWQGETEGVAVCVEV